MGLAPPSGNCAHAISLLDLAEISDGDQTEESILRRMLDLLLRSGAPKLLLWRAELLAFYNDAYAHLDTGAGTELLGLSYPKMRQDIWEPIKDYTLRAQAGENQIHAEKMLFCQSVEEASPYRFCQLFFTPITCRDQSVCGVLIDIHDNTDGHQLSERLLIENQQLQSIFQEAPFMMAYASTENFTLQFVNQEFSRFYNNRPLQGLPVRRAIPEAQEQGFDVLLNDVVNSGQPFRANAMEVRVREGEREQPKYVDFIYHPVKADGGDISGVLCTGTDVTEKVKARIGLEKTRHRLLHASRINAMGTVAMTLAHELNQPLTAAANYLSASRRLLQHDHREANEAFNTIMSAQEQIDRAGDIIRRIRPLIQSGEAERRKVSISAAVERSVGLLLASGKFDLEVSKDISRDAAYVLADQIQLEQVLVNLLRNANEASMQSDRKEVIIATTRDDMNCAVISVRDFGPGLLENQIEELQSVYSDGVNRGLGVGLLLSRTLIEANGGSLRATNAATGNGAVFEIVLQATELQTSQPDR